MACIFRHQVPSSREALMIIDKTIVMGAQADPELLNAMDDAHHKAIGSMVRLITALRRRLIGTMACFFRHQVFPSL